MNRWRFCLGFDLSDFFIGVTWATEKMPLMHTNSAGELESIGYTRVTCLTVCLIPCLPLCIQWRGKLNFNGDIDHDL